MRDPGILAPRHFWFARHFLWIDGIVPGKAYISKRHFFARNFYEKMKSAFKSAEVKDTILAGTFCEKMKSAWKGAEVKDTFLPGTVYDELKSAWKGAEVKDTFFAGNLYEKKSLHICT